MAQRLTRNTFEGGLNTDIDISKIDPIFYTDAHNLELVSNGKFHSFTNIAGTTDIKNLIGTGTNEVLGVFANTYLISGTAKKCLTVFFTNNSTFNIWCVDVDAAATYKLFQETVDNAYLTSDNVVDAFGYAENNVDYVYFADDNKEIRSFRCEIPSPYTDNFLSAADISVLRRGANGIITLDSILTGGALLSGAYQFTYRMVNPVNKKFTKWSSLTLPIHVYSAANSSSSPVFSDYGLPTTFKIRLDITPTPTELSNFSYFQLAVVENIYPTGAEAIVDGDNRTFVASVLPIQATSTYLSSGVLQNYEFKTNAKIGVIPIEEIVVDLAAVKSAKTISVKENKLIAGGIKYHSFTFDHGEPSVISGSVITKTISLGDIFSSHEQSIFRGYFRDEVYRLGIVYRDTFGNKAPAKILDMRAVTNNQISGSAIDMKFPSRSTNNAFTIMDNNGSPDRIRSLGLNLSAIRNHPSWAVGFDIVRVKRKKKILSQSPLIPMSYVQGVGAINNYPSDANTVPDGGDPETTYPDAQPQTTSKVYVPKNLFWPESRVISRATSSVGSGVSTGKIGESKLVRNSTNIPVAMIFPQNHMYDDGVFTLSGSEKLQTIDFCTLRLAPTEYSSGIAGDLMNTKIKGTFYALDAGDYYFDPAWSGKSLAESLAPINGYIAFKNLGISDSLNGKKIMDYDSLKTANVDYGFAPQIQKSVVVDAPTIDNHEVMGVRTLTFANAGATAVVGSSVPLFSGNPSLTYENQNTISNKYVTEYSGFSSSYVQAIKIVNIINDYSDDRYGDIDAEHEFISTGASYIFNPTELANIAAGSTVDVNIDVFGGDCFVSPHTFKISDGAYSVVNQQKWNTPGTADSSSNLISKWSKYFLNSSGSAISLPIGLEGVAQFVTVILESEYNGGVMAQDLLISLGFTNNIPIMTSSGGEENLKAPLTYRYNINLSKQNDEKVYLPLPSFNFQKNDFPARVLWSDQKIYNTDDIGFDVIRVLNFKDLEEKNGKITKLALEGDNLYAIQEKGIVGLPVGETQLTTTDAGSLSIGTSSFLGRPIMIDDKRGGQHLKGIVETGSIIYIPDVNNKAVYALIGNQLQPIHDGEFNNETLFRTLFSTVPTQRSLKGIYDAFRGEYWIAGANYCYRFNEKRKQWISNFEFPSGSLSGGVSTNSKLYLVSKIANLISVKSMYTGIANSLFGTIVTPRVTVSINPDDPISKTFDNQMYVATQRLATADFTVEREDELTDQVVSGTIIEVPSVEGNYRIKLPRASTLERLRGLRMITTIKWKTTNLFSTLSAIYTKYRHSSRTPF
jgi:hypothetical protein